MRSTLDKIKANTQRTTGIAANGLQQGVKTSQTQPTVTTTRSGLPANTSNAIRSSMQDSVQAVKNRANSLFGGSTTPTAPAQKAPESSASMNPNYMPQGYVAPKGPESSASMNPNYVPPQYQDGSFAANNAAASFNPVAPSRSTGYDTFMQQGQQPSTEAFDYAGEGYNDFYANLAREDYQAAQRDRDVTRADMTRQAREAAIAGGVDPSSSRYQAMIASADAGANAQALQSRNDFANRAQSLMLQQRDEDMQNQEKLLEFLDNTQRQAYFEGISKGMSPGDAMASLYGEDGSFRVQAPSAYEQGIQEETEAIMSYYPGMSEAEARAKAVETQRKAFEETNKTLTDSVKVEDRIPYVTQNLAEGNTGAKGWTEQDFKAAEEAGLLDKLTVPDVSKLSLSQNPVNVYGAGFRQGETVLVNGEYYRVESIDSSRRDDSYYESLTGGSTWTKGKAQLKALTGPDAGKMVDFDTAKNRGT